MVKEERREDDVHAPVAEGKPERVGDDDGSARGEPRMRRLPVEAEDADARSRFGGRRQDVVVVEELGFGTSTGNPEAHRPCLRSQRDRPLRRMSAEFFEPKAIPLQSANSTWAGRAAFG